MGRLVEIKASRAEIAAQKPCLAAGFRVAQSREDFHPMARRAHRVTQWSRNVGKRKREISVVHTLTQIRAKCAGHAGGGEAGAYSDIYIAKRRTLETGRGPRAVQKNGGCDSEDPAQRPPALALGGRVPKHPPKPRHAQPALVKDWVRAQQGRPRVPGVSGGPQIEWSGRGDRLKCA
jgi:hypothetical protein